MATANRDAPSARILRVVRWPLVRAVLGAAWIIALVVGLQVLLGKLPGHATALFQLGGALLVAALSLAAYVAFVRVLERRPVRELAARGAAGEATAGVLLGVGLFTLTIGILAVMGLYHVDGRNPWRAALPVLGAAIASGVFEELLMRGIVFRILEDAAGTWLALVASALLFGALHMANPHASLVAAVALALEAGVILAAAYVATRRLWLAIGLHAGWNFTQGGVFGVAVSGHAATGVLRGRLTGPVLLSGGEFGAEASVVAVVVCLVAGALLLARGARRGHLIAPAWRRPRAPGVPEPAAPSAVGGG